jgi:TolA-binding protein
MLYNAKAKYKEAEALPKQKDGTVTRQQMDAYGQAIEKAQAMIDKYPGSRHVDNAYLLIANSQFKQAKYEDAIGTVDTLLTKLPDTDLKEEALFIKAHSYTMSDRSEEGLAALEAYIEEYRGNDHMDQALYLAAKNALIVGEEEKAMRYVDRLRREYRGSQYRLEADIETAEVYLERGEYDKCVEIYERLTRSRLEVKNRYRVWSALASAYIETGRPNDALTALKALDKLSVTDIERADAMLLKGKAHVGVGEIPEAIESYKNVAARFPKSKFSAEAHYHMGALFQEMDSLEVAKTHFESVTKSYPGSDYANQAIKNSSNISQLIKLRQSEGEESPEAKSLRLFSLAEVQLFQFEDPDKAIESYRLLLVEFPESEYAPKAAYALGYVYGEIKGDSVSAREAMMTLIRDYPDTQQAAQARDELGLPPVEREAVRPEGADEDAESASLDGEENQ